MDDGRWLSLQRDLIRAIGPHVPGWTEASDADPGITMLELFAFLSETLLQRVEPSEHARGLAARIAGAYAVYAGSGGEALPSAAVRLRYFEGRFLTAADYRLEQEYFLRKHRRHLQAFHGSGIVNGLRVEGSAAGDDITVRAGLAIDAEGREILLPEDTCIRVGAQDSRSVFVIVEYAERGIAPLPTAAGSTSEPSLLEEACRVTFSPSAPSGGVAIARVAQTASGWQVDNSYVPPRTR